MKTAHNNWLTPWVELELTSTNVGIDHVVNPTLYPALLYAIENTSEPISLYDFGCGTSSLAIDLLIRNPHNVPALAPLAHERTQQAREKVTAYRGYEIETALVDHANARFTFYGAERMRTSRHDASQAVTPIDDTQAVAVSRNLLMHLSADELRKHLHHTAMLVGKNGYYTFSVLNPAYEQRKQRTKLAEEQRYVFGHGSHGELGSFTHYYRSQEKLHSYLEETFHIEKIVPCRPLNNDYRQTHARYYDPATPIAFVYVVRSNHF